jgi:hypothetical protein
MRRIPACVVLAAGLLLALPSHAQDLHEQLEAYRDSLNEHMAALRQQFRLGQSRRLRSPDCVGVERTERFSRRLRLASGGSVAVANIAGSIAIAGASGDEVSIEATKRTRCDASELSLVTIVVDERGGRLDVKTEYPRSRDSGGVSVDFVITVPARAPAEARSVSGDIRIERVRGAVRAETVSGDVTAVGVAELELAKSVSGDVDLTGADEAADLTAGSVSGDVRARNIRARSLNVNTVSGSVTLADVATGRLAAKSMSGDMNYSGSLARAGRYELTTHSGDVRLTLRPDTGFELDASTFSGSIRSELPLTLSGDIRPRGARNAIMHATFGDGSAALTIRTFSGGIVITR